MRGRLQATDIIHVGEANAQRRLREIKANLTSRLIQEAKSLGATGGMVTFLVGPGARDVWNHDELQQRYDGFTIDGRVLASAISPTATFQAMKNGEIQSETKWLFRHGSKNNSLRQLLVGTSPSCRQSLHEGGDSGMFEVPAWPLANFEQWWFHFEITKGLHLYDFWGDWCGQVPSKPRRQQVVLVNCTGARRGKLHRENKFRQANIERCQVAAVRRESLIAQVLPIWNSLGGHSLRRIGWRQLRSKCITAGIAISQRDARWLAMRFKACV
jgi:hypothetical protein